MVSIKTLQKFTHNNRDDILTLEDTAGQLVGATYATPHPHVANTGGGLTNATYTYDPAGNRTTATANAVPTLYQVNDVNQYTQVGLDAQTYNSRGDLLKSQRFCADVWKCPLSR